jgi:hypothetical protein
MEVLPTFCLVWPWTMILPISASIWVVKITGMKPPLFLATWKPLMTSRRAGRGGWVFSSTLVPSAWIQPTFGGPGFLTWYHNSILHSEGIWDLGGVSCSNRTRFYNYYCRAYCY